MKNYYEILEVSKNASKEIIEKAYKVLAKKYHPDLQQESERKKAEEKMKIINEAYEILSDDEKRKNYDIELEMNIQRQKELENKKQQEEIRKKYKTNNTDAVIKNNNYDQRNNMQYQYEVEKLRQQQLEEQLEQEREKRRQMQEQQEIMYRNYMRSLGYRVKERWTWKKTKRLIKTIAVLIIAILIIWIFPPTHKLLIETYENNDFIKAFVDITLNVIKGLFDGIHTFFTGLFAKK